MILLKQYFKGDGLVVPHAVILMDTPEYYIVAIVTEQSAKLGEYIHPEYFKKDSLLKAVDSWLDKTKNSIYPPDNKSWWLGNEVELQLKPNDRMIIAAACFHSNTQMFAIVLVKIGDSYQIQHTSPDAERNLDKPSTLHSVTTDFVDAMTEFVHQVEVYKEAYTYTGVEDWIKPYYTH